MKQKYSKWVVGAASAALVASAIVPVASAASFSDIESSDHKDAILALADANIVGGYPDGTFKPNAVVTRGNVTKFLGKWLVSEGYEIPTDYKTEARFTDLPTTTPDQELLQYAALVKDAGVFKGSNNKLMHTNNMSREQMAVVLVRAIKTVYGVDLVADYKESDFKSAITDLDNTTATENREAIIALEYAGLTNVKAFNPKNSLTRGQFASFLNRTITNVAPTPAPVKVESANATNGTITVKLAEKAEAVEAEDFTVTQAINGGEATEVKASAAVLSADGLTVTLTVDKVAAQEITEQSVVYTVNEVAAPAFVVEATNAVVTSVTAINAKEIKVAFNKPVKATTVEAADFTVTKNNGTAVAISAASDAITVAEDGRSAVITLDAGLSNNDVVKVVVAKDSILTSAYDKFEGATFSDIKFVDNQAPKLLSAKATDGTTVELTFDEPVDWTTNVGGISVNGATLVAGANTTKAGNYTYSFTVAQLKSGANTVQVLNYADFAANKEALTTTTVDYVADTSIPEVSSIKAEDSASFIVTLNKAVDTIAKTNFTVKKGNYTFDSNDLTVGYVDAKGADSVAATKYVKVTVPTQATTANPLYGTDEASVGLSVALSGYKNGTVLGKEYTGSVTLSKDVAAPKVVSSKLITFNKTAKTITVPFDKTLTLADATKLTVVSGSVKVAATPTVDGKNLVITIDDAAGLTDGNYSLVLDKGLVKDGSNNVNEATTLSTTVSNAVATLVKDGTIFGTTAVAENGKNVITVTYGVKVDDAAATASSYSLNGSALPSGSVVYFTSSAKDTVKIELPASYTVGLDNLSAKLSLNANAVKVADSTSADYGKVISSSATEAKSIEQVVTLKDNVAPTVTKVEYIKDSATGLATGLKLTFSENVDDSTLDGGTNPTFVIKQGTTNVAYTMAAPAGTDAADDNVLTLSFAGNLTLAASNVVLYTSATATDLTLTDLSGNNKIGAISGISAQ
ncbi:S-layer homology domain-containing protein [Lysinibacillus sp. NPDC097195]|uniref:S-layer homology domain-containing protein n=1 Tax=Lysinibacillus sp. NPDC097195 TaxID=3364141 RepID=UPI0037F25E01